MIDLPPPDSPASSDCVSSDDVPSPERADDVPDSEQVAGTTPPADSADMAGKAAQLPQGSAGGNQDDGAPTPPVATIASLHQMALAAASNSELCDTTVRTPAEPRAPVS